MSLSAVSSASPFATSGLQTDYKKARADFKALSSALQSNDLTGAQQDFAALQQDAPVFAQALSSAQTTATASPVADLKTLSSALQSNDLTGAQGALAALKQDVSTSVAGVPHHHHRHHYGAGNSSTTPASGAAPATSGSVINLQA